MVHHQEPAAVGGGGGQVSALHEKQQLDDELFCRQARAHAEALFDQHHSTSAQSKAAWDSGDHRLAKQLSDESKQLRRAAEIASLAAARKIFDMKNSRVQPEEIDLHGLHVDEAVKFTEERIDLDVNSSKELVIVIYGAGEFHEVNARRIRIEISCNLAIDSWRPRPCTLAGTIVETSAHAGRHVRDTCT